MRALQARGIFRQSLVHTGQHYDVKMSEVFFRQLELPESDVKLEVGSGSHARQTAQIMLALEPVILDRKPNLVLVYGDLNSTLAAALVCGKLGIPFGHVEAGLRSRDRTMPEEVKRLLTDQVADLLFTPSLDGNENLEREGVPEARIHFVGNVMIDTLVRCLPLSQQQPLTMDLPSCYALVTLHRPSKVNDSRVLSGIISMLAEMSKRLAILFTIHPRTRKAIGGIPEAGGVSPRVRLLDPLGYLEFLFLQRRAAVVITDSGGIQEETTYLGVPCLTLRSNTERGITVTTGTNVLIGDDMNRLREEVDRILTGKGKKGKVPPLWDGMAGERIAMILESWSQQR